MNKDLDNEGEVKGERARDMEAALNVLTRDCTRCNHQWLLRTPEEPRVCPKCKSPYWAIARRK